MRERVDREGAWTVAGLAAAALLGAVIGIIAIPSATLVIAVMTIVQLGVSALGLLAPRRPVLWAAAIAAVSLGSTLLDPRLSELAYSGAIPWVTIATFLGVQNLYRHAKDWLVISSGTAALALGSVGVVAVSIREGLPPTPAVLAASVPFLIGVLMATMYHLRDAREDRVRRPELSAEVTEEDEAPVAFPGTLDAARRALAIVALRSENLVALTDDTPARRAAADMRDLACRALTGESTSGTSLARTELHASGSPREGDAHDGKPAVPPMPELPDREREILRLVATGASNAAIGRSLYLSEATVKQYVSRLMRKFERDNRTQLALMAARWFDGPQ